MCYYSAVPRIGSPSFQQPFVGCSSIRHSNAASGFADGTEKPSLYGTVVCYNLAIVTLGTFIQSVGLSVSQTLASGSAWESQILMSLGILLLGPCHSS